VTIGRVRSVGLTGGIAAGKSTVGRMLEERGFTVVDADRLVASLYEPGGEGSRAVRDLFGPELLTGSGAVDREAVARRVFRDAAARRRLEAAIHPLVRRRFEEIAARTEGIAVLEATLLVEAGWGEGFDALITVEAPRETRIGRAVARGLSRQEAEARLRAQGRSEDRRRAADFVIENDGSLVDLERRVDAVVGELSGARG
jgi:dephospho-CoA kinase